eukprot:TRINITY_DN10430_c0_g1_i1.p1 TRINITY_DN10430_c0_g1~~TRINITY_DN10430_c0_g1_i1.p1  ORF type:complete len:345 (-),score=33.04 TRINITY_DN10430_c0_g1_i1:19-1026(-)
MPRNMASDVAGLPRSRNFDSMLCIVPPRQLWHTVQPMRTESCPNLRLGPHITLLDPFVIPEAFPQAAENLQHHLAEFPPFTVTLRRVDQFTRRREAWVILRVESEPEGALLDLHRRLCELFPQCAHRVAPDSECGEQDADDLGETTDGTPLFIPHLSIGKVAIGNADADRRFRSKLEAFTGLSFTVNELYLAHRGREEPFSAHAAVALGRHARPSSPIYGPGALSDGGASGDEHDRRIARSVVLCGLPAEVSEAQIREGIEEVLAVRPVAAEVLVDVDNSRRPVAVVEFETAEDAQYIADCGYVTLAGKSGRCLPLSSMLFPDVVGGTCSPAFTG